MKRVISDVDRHKLEGSLSLVASYINALIAKYGPDAELEFRAVDDYGGYTVEADVSRLETDEERAKREESENHWKKLEAERRHAEYLKLKQEFEPE